MWHYSATSFQVDPLPDRLMVGLRFLVPSIGVRVPVRQQKIMHCVTVCSINGVNLKHMKKGYKASVEDVVHAQTNFRHVLYTGEKMQLVAMTIQPGDDIGEEVHEGHDQFFRIEHGNAKVMIDETTYEATAGDLIIVPSGANHNVTNLSDSETLVLYTIYTPPEHEEGTTHATKAEAEADDEHFDGRTTE